MEGLGGLVLEGGVWLSLVLIAYTYVGYPLLLVGIDAGHQLWGNLARLSGGLERRQAREASPLPTVSLVFAAYNEAAVLREKLVNCLALDYPQDRLEILVGSDGSTDGTDDLVRSFAWRGVALSTAPRAGKAGVLNRLIPRAKGEFVVLSDANTLFEPKAIRRLVARFDSPTVAAVCGQLRLEPTRAASGTDRSGQESAYWSYESAIKLYEGKLGCLMGANGAIYALRRSLFEPLPAGTITDDFAIPLRLLAQGFQVVYEPAAVATEEAPARLADEVRRRARIGAGNLQSLSLFWPLLRGGGPMAQVAFVSHKLLRWLTPLFMVVALIGALASWSQPPCRVALFAQLAFYAAAISGSFGHRGGTVGRLCRLAHYFVSMNGALALGALRQLRRTQPVTWDPTPRS